jgi:hypothetical protein
MDARTVDDIFRYGHCDVRMPVRSVALPDADWTPSWTSLPATPRGSGELFGAGDGTPSVKKKEP